MTTELATTDDPGVISVLPPAQTISTSAIAQLTEHARVMQTAYELAEAMCSTALVPAIYRGKPQDGTAAILYGAELGLSPIQSLQQIFPVHGMPSIYARTMVALVNSRGYRVWTVSSADDAVTVCGESPAGDREQSTWTIERATKAGYVPTIDEKTGKYALNSNGKLIGNEKYLKDPQAMLYAKAASEVCRKLAPEVLLGISYSKEDLESENFDDEQIRRPARRVRSDRRGVEGLREAIGVGAQPEPAGADPTPEADATEAAPTPKGMAESTRKKWINRQFQLLSQGDCTDAEDQRIVLAVLAGRTEPLEHRDGLTDDELKAVVNEMNNLDKSGELGQKITDILNEYALAEESNNAAAEEN